MSANGALYQLVNCNSVFTLTYEMFNVVYGLWVVSIFICLIRYEIAPRKVKMHRASQYFF